MKVERKKRDENELLCRCHILNNLSDHLHDLFYIHKVFKENMEVTRVQIQHKRQGVDKFFIVKYFEFLMIDNTSVIDYIYKLQVLISKPKYLKVEVSKALQVG